MNRYFTVCSLQRRQQFLNLDTTTTRRSRRSMTFSFFRLTSPSELFIIQCCRQQPRTAIRCRPSSIPAGVQEHARLLLLAALVYPPTLQPSVGCMTRGIYSLCSLSTSLSTNAATSCWLHELGLYNYSLSSLSTNLSTSLSTNAETSCWLHEPGLYTVYLVYSLVYPPTLQPPAGCMNRGSRTSLSTNGATFCLKAQSRHICRLATKSSSLQCKS